MAGRGGRQPRRQPTTAAWRARRVARHGSAARGTSGDETRGDGAAMRSGVGSASRVGAMPAERPLRRVVVAGASHLLLDEAARVLVNTSDVGSNKDSQGEGRGEP